MLSKSAFRSVARVGMFGLLCLLTPALSAQIVTYTEEIKFPSDAGALNVMSYGAVGDGVHDDTAAITAAINDSGANLGNFTWQDKIVYFPNGTYKVSAPLVKTYSMSPLTYGKGMILVGESKTGVTIKLADSATGYGSATSPLAVIKTTSTGAGGTANHTGDGTDAYRNSIENLTINVGAGNPGAIGISYLANNIGSIRNVVITGSGTSGLNGIDMTRGFAGPCELENVQINGFQYGIVVGNTEYGITLEHITLNGQFAGGIVNYQNMLAINYLSTNGAGKALHNFAISSTNAGSTPNGLVVIENSSLIHSGAAPILIDNAGSIVFHNTNVSNAESFTGVASTEVDGTLKAGEGLSNFTAQTRPWNISYVDTPVEPYDASTTWHAAGGSSADFTAADGSITGTPIDATSSIQAALNSGASTVYFPHGVYYISANLTVPATVTRIVGMDSTLRVIPSPGAGYHTSEGMIHVGTPANVPLIIERMGFDGTGYGTPIAVDLTYDNRPPTGQLPVRDVVLRDTFTNAVHLPTRAQFGGRLFMEDVCCGSFTITGTALVAARQLDVETKGYGSSRINNNGAPLWILGLKEESPNAVLVSTAGAATQILGGLIYTTPGTSFPTAPSTTTCSSSHTSTSTATNTPATFVQTSSWVQANFSEEVLESSTLPSGKVIADYRFPYYVSDPTLGCMTNSIGIARTGTQPSGAVESGFVVPVLIAGPSTPPVVP